MTIKSPPLSAEQIEHFTRRGYLVCGQSFSPTETAAFAAAYDECLDALHAADRLNNIRRGQLDDGTQTQVHQIRCAHLAHPLFDDLIRDPRILDPVETLIGPNLKLILCQGLYKPPHTGGEIDWHQDDYYFRVDKKNAVVSCWISFDEATVDSGCMWVLPEVHTQLWDHERLDSPGYRMIDPDEGKAIALEMPAGRFMFHHGSTPHRTLVNTTEHPRRAMAMHYMDATARTLDGIREAEPAENMPVVRGSAAR